MNETYTKHNYCPQEKKLVLEVFSLKTTQVQSIVNSHSELKVHLEVGLPTIWTF